MSDMNFYASGKILLTAEYFVLSGARALALPTRFGQHMHIKSNSDITSSPKINWKSLDSSGNSWLNVELDLNDLTLISASDEEIAKVLQNILKEAKSLNTNFLAGSDSIEVITSLEFNKEWGLGSSSTLISLIAQWAEISPFELLEKTFGGSGYDLACAQEKQPIIYELKDNKETWQLADFKPNFSSNLYFVHMNKKQNSREGIKHYREQNFVLDKALIHINSLTDRIQTSQTLNEFEDYISEHEELVSEVVKLPKVKNEYFSDYWGAIKSLGAWGGDFVLATSSKDEKQTYDYFEQKGYKTILKYSELIL